MEVRECGDLLNICMKLKGRKKLFLLGLGPELISQELCLEGSDKKGDAFQEISVLKGGLGKYFLLAAGSS